MNQNDESPFQRFRSTILYTIAGCFLGIGAPLGALVIRRTTHGIDLRRDLEQNAFFYLYELTGTCGLLGIAGFAAGLRADTLRRREARYRELSEHDDLTQLPNARAFHQRFDRAVERSQRHQLPLSLLLIDVDGLKRLNDRFGHAFGSQVLCYVTSVIDNAKRLEDFAARWGGDEFAIVMQGADRSAGVRVAGRILELLEQQPFRHNDIEHRISVTIGVASMTSPLDSEQFFKMADAALYEGKIKGRSQLRVASPS